MAEVAAYTHIIIAFAVSYTWSPGKNICSSTCQIAEPPVCDNAPNPTLVQQFQAAGKKVILSFGGAGMGGSWDGDVNDCWEYCYGRETQVTSRLVQIVNNMGLDGVDLDFEYHVTATAVAFLNQLTTGLKNALPDGSEVTHAPMDSDIIPGKPYYENILKITGHQLDFLMPQYYNGFTRPAVDGIAGTGAGSMSALSHYTDIVNDIFGGDAKRMVFGFCISDCGGTGSNAASSQASTVMSDLALTYPCNGGAFFWVAEDDANGLWSSGVGNTISTLASMGCSSSTPPPVDPSPAPVSDAPVTLRPADTPAPVESTPAPVSAPDPEQMCCQPGENKLKAFNDCTQYYTCSWGNLLPNLVGPLDGVLFDENIQNWNWAAAVQCHVDPCDGSSPPPPPLSSPSPTGAPNPEPAPPQPSYGDPCCPTGYTGLRAWNRCLQYYSCHYGAVVAGSLYDVPQGTLFDQNLQNTNWEDQVICVVDSCADGRWRNLR